MHLRDAAFAGWVLMVPCLGAQARQVSDAGRITYDRPSCAQCRLRLETAPSVLTAGRDTSLWFGQVIHVAFDSAGRLYIADLLRHDIVRFDPRSGGVFLIGSEGEGPGEFRWPLLLTPTHDGIFVYDGRLRRISVFDTAGHYARSFPTPPEIGLIESMTTDHHGHLYVSARPPGQFLVHKLSTQGDLLASFPEPAADGQTTQSTGILWWDASSQSVWYSRRGPRFQLLQIDTTGTVVKHLQLRDGALSSPPGGHIQQTADGRLLFRPSATLGTVAVFPLPGGYLANATLQDPARRRFRYDVFRLKDGAFVARWIEEREDPITFGDGESWVAGLRFDQPDVTRYRVEFRDRGP